MPRTKGKYDRPQFIKILSTQERKQRNAFYFMEKLLQIDPDFRARYSEIKGAFETGRIQGEQARKMVWQEMQRAVRKQ
jgi:hypothetical protein